MHTSRDDGDRPSLKVFLQGSTGVYGVDGQPVVMIRRPPGGSSTNTDRQLSFNCPRYITVGWIEELFFFDMMNAPLLYARLMLSSCCKMLVVSSP